MSVSGEKIKNYQSTYLLKTTDQPSLGSKSKGCFNPSNTNFKISLSVCKISSDPVKKFAKTCVLNQYIHFFDTSGVENIAHLNVKIKDIM